MAVKRPGRRGRFITFEGGDGAGKSLQASRLADRLERIGLKVVRTREPGGSPRAEALRELLLSGAAKHFGATGEALLFGAARIDHIDQTIRPALKAGAWVVCDRFADSTRAYQGAAGHVDPQFIASLERVVVGDCQPDLTLILDLPVAIGLERSRARRAGADADRFEREDPAFHETLRQAFLKIARDELDRCAVIDASLAPGIVSQAIWAEVERRLGAALPAQHLDLL